MWEWAKGAEEIEKQIETLRSDVQSGMWRNPNAR